MEREVYITNAFELKGSGGNPAGIVLDAEGLSTPHMLAIAEHVGLSETAFVLPSEVCDFRLRFFTPADEVDLCGHATIAAYSLLHQLGRLAPGSYRQELPAGELGISVSSDGRVSMEQLCPCYSAIFSPDEISSILGIDPGSITVEGLPIQLVSTGLSDVLVPTVSRQALDSVSPEFPAMSEFNKRHDSVGFHVFWLTGQSSGPTAVCRNFAPLYGIEEESATGSSSGALACYLAKHWERNDHFEFQQGFSIGRPSHIEADLTYTGDTISHVIVSGYAGDADKKIIRISS